LKSSLIPLAILSLSAVSSAQTLPYHHVSRPFTPQVTTATATGASIPVWTGTDGTYTYKMVGQSPLVAQANQTSSVNVPIVPLRFVFSDGTTLDASTTDSTCSSAGSASSLLQASPLFNNFSWTVGGTAVGNTQYEDFFQRANYWKYTGAAGGINPDYHILLTASPRAVAVINVPAASGNVTTAGCGKLGHVDINWLDSYLQRTVYVQTGILPTEFPVFLTYNVAIYDPTSSGSGSILGYHSAFADAATGNAIQTYAVTDFDTTGSFGGGRDVSIATHEIGEWLADPYGSNATPQWGHVGQVSGCQSDLEVGDPLTGTDIIVTMPNNYTYHLQELAFTSWFYRDAASTGVNGWYSSNGAFTNGAQGCNTDATTLSFSSVAVPNGGQVTATVKVSPVQGAGVPTGAVNLVSSASAVLGTLTLANGTATGVVTLPAGTYTVTADYPGDGVFPASNSSPVTINPPVTPPTTGTVKLSATSLDFGSVNVGTLTTAQAITVTNTATTAQTRFTVSLLGADPIDFNVTNGCSKTLAAAATCTIQVTFRTLTAGARSATLSVGGTPVSLTGTGTGGAQLKLSVTSLAFGSSPVGTATATQTVTLSNPGTAKLNGLIVYLNGIAARDFPGTTACGSSIAAGASCAVQVAFQPTIAGARSATLNVFGASANSLQTVALIGTGTGGAQLKVSATSLSFGTSRVGAATAAQTLTISNTGTATMNSLSISLLSRDFKRTSQCGSSLAAGASCTIKVVFDPVAKGARGSNLMVTALAAGSPQDVTLTGTGQ
jgi:Bacterial Ig-like domain (group 3)/Abnormal spindle-like microcephaly-assoc'd, ASPM-SPD-2-Hydin